MNFVKKNFGFCLSASALFLCLAYVLWETGVSHNWIFAGLVVCILLVVPICRRSVQDGGLGLASGVFLICLIVTDTLLFFKVATIGKAHDLDVIPHHSLPIWTKDKFVVYAQEPDFSAEMVSAGQISSYLPDSGFYEPRKIRVTTDSLGFRNDLQAHERCVSLLLMGDSFAFGYGTDQNKIWSHLLNTQSMPPISGHTYNIGVYGASPSNQAELMRYLFDEGKLKPCKKFKAVMIFFEGNDLTDPNVYRHKHELSNYVSTLIYFWHKYSMLSNMQAFVISVLSEKNKVDPDYEIWESKKMGKIAVNSIYVYRAKIFPEDPNIIEDYIKKNEIMKSFERYSERIKKLGGRAAVLFIPSKSTAYQGIYSQAPRVGTEFTDPISRLAKEADLDFIDATPRLKEAVRGGEHVFWRDDTHINEKGHQIIANIVCDYVGVKCSF